MRQRTGGENNGMKMQEHIRERKKIFDENCSRCGACFTACPVVPFTHLAGSEPQKMTRGVLDMLTNGAPGEEAVTWATSCTLCGACVPRCPESLNVRELFYLGRSAAEADGEAAQDYFTSMSHGIRLLAHLQMTAMDFRRLTDPLGWGTNKSEILLYYGCNVLRTPDILLTAIDVLHRLGVNFAVLGGPANCCGSVHFRLGDIKRAEKVEDLTYQRWLSFSPERVLLWCPNCEMHFLESGLRERRQPPFVIENFAEFLAGRVAQLNSLYVRTVRKRAALHEHEGHQLENHVRKILLSVPGLELVEIPQLKRYGYNCGKGSQGMAPAEVQAEVHERLLEEARAAGIDLLLTSNHACQISLCAYEAQQPFQIKNFLSVVGEALGIERADLFKRYALCGDAEKVVETAAKFVRDNHLDTGRVKHDVARALAWGR